MKLNGIDHNSDAIDIFVFSIYFFWSLLTSGL